MFVNKNVFVITKNSDWKILTKKFNFMGRGEESQKNNIQGYCLKREAQTVCRFMDLARKRGGGVFEWVHHVNESGLSLRFNIF